MRVLGFVVVIALALIVSGCVTAKQETAGADVSTSANVKTNPKPVAKITPKPQTPIRTLFMEI